MAYSFHCCKFSTSIEINEAGKIYIRSGICTSSFWAWFFFACNWCFQLQLCKVNANLSILHCLCFMPTIFNYCLSFHPAATRLWKSFGSVYILCGCLGLLGQGSCKPLILQVKVTVNNLVAYMNKPKSSKDKKAVLIESQNHRMGKVGRGHSGSSGPASWLKKSHPEMTGLCRIVSQHFLNIFILDSRYKKSEQIDKKSKIIQAV